MLALGWGADGRGVLGQQHHPGGMWWEMGGLREDVVPVERSAGTG